MTTRQPTLEHIAEWPIEGALAYNDPLEDIIEVQLAPDVTEEGVDYGVLEEGKIFTFRDEATNKLVGLTLQRASTVIELASQNRSHILRTLIPEETLTDLTEAFYARRRGYVAVRYSVTE